MLTIAGGILIALAVICFGIPLALGSIYVVFIVMREIFRAAFRGFAKPVVLAGFRRGTFVRLPFKWGAVWACIAAGITLLISIVGASAKGH
jgi:hypothetical protein